MTDFFAGLLNRSIEQGAVFRPRRLSRFEASARSSGPGGDIAALDRDVAGPALPQLPRERRDQPEAPRQAVDERNPRQAESISRELRDDRDGPQPVEKRQDSPRPATGFGDWALQQLAHMRGIVARLDKSAPGPAPDAVPADTDTVQIVQVQNIVQAAAEGQQSRAPAGDSEKFVRPMPRPQSEGSAPRQPSAPAPKPAVDIIAKPRTTPPAQYMSANGQSPLRENPAISPDATLRIAERPSLRPSLPPLPRPVPPQAARRDAASVSSHASTIHVSIGRIEVRAVTAPAPEKAARTARPSAPRLSLDEYLKSRNGAVR